MSFLNTLSGDHLDSANDSANDSASDNDSDSDSAIDNESASASDTASDTDSKPQKWRYPAFRSHQAPPTTGLDDQSQSKESTPEAGIFPTVQG
jgi:hypothetical protein